MARKFWLVLACLCVSAAPASAQEGVLSELYGKGVHAYFAGRPWVALDHLNSAIAAGSEDPRAFYFRGLTYLQLGDGSTAGDDFQHAAALETADSNEFYDVSRALERIQGPQRLSIERYRTAGRLEAMQRTRQLEYERYERVREAEPRVTIPPEESPLEAFPDERMPPPDDEPAEEPAEPAADPFQEEPEAAMPEDEPVMPEEEPALPNEEPAFPADEPALPDAEPVMEPEIEAAPALPPIEQPGFDEPALPEPDVGAEPDAGFEPDLPGAPNPVLPGVQPDLPGAVDPVAPGIEPDLPGAPDPFLPGEEPAADEPDPFPPTAVEPPAAAAPGDEIVPDGEPAPDDEPAMPAKAESDDPFGVRQTIHWFARHIGYSPLGISSWRIFR